MIDGTRYAGAAVVTIDKIIWAQALGHWTSAQRAKMIALTQALRYGKDKTVSIYTDSRYAFATAHVHGAIYRERLVNLRRKDYQKSARNSGLT